MRQNLWFRVWTDITSNPKIKLLAFEDRWHFIAVLAMKKNGLLDTDRSSDKLKSRMIAAEMGLDPVEAAEVKRRLVEVDLIGEDWQPKKWDDRQFVSDCSTERVRAYREKLKNETSMKRFRNVSETPPENREQRTETEKGTTPPTPPFEKKPTGKNKIDTDGPGGPVEVGKNGSCLKKHPYPDWLDRKLFSDFARMRSRIKKPITTAKTITGLLNKLEKIVADGHDQGQIIQEAIDRCWLNFYPPKDEGRKVDRDGKEWVV